MSLPYALLAWFDIQGKRKSIEQMRNTPETSEFSETVFGILTCPVIKKKIKKTSPMRHLILFSSTN